mgnify:CR=1 FL=1
MTCGIGSAVISVYLTLLPHLRLVDSWLEIVSLFGWYFRSEIVYTMETLHITIHNLIILFLSVIGVCRGCP